MAARWLRLRPTERRARYRLLQLGDIVATKIDIIKHGHYGFVPREHASRGQEALTATG